MMPLLGPIRARQAGLRGLIERVEQAHSGPSLDAAVAALGAFARANAAARLAELYSPLALTPDLQLRSIVLELLESELALDASFDALLRQWPPARRADDREGFRGELGAMLENQRLLLDLEAQVLHPLLEPPAPFDLAAAAGLFALTPPPR